MHARYRLLLSSIFVLHSHEHLFYSQRTMAFIQDEDFGLTSYFCKGNVEHDVTESTSHGTPTTIMTSSDSIENGGAGDVSSSNDPEGNNWFEVLAVSSHSLSPRLPHSPKAPKRGMCLTPKVFSPRGPQNMNASLRSVRSQSSAHSSWSSNRASVPQAPLLRASTDGEVANLRAEERKANNSSLEDIFDHGSAPRATRSTSTGTFGSASASEALSADSSAVYSLQLNDVFPNATFDDQASADHHLSGIMEDEDPFNKSYCDSNVSSSSSLTAPSTIMHHHDSNKLQKTLTAAMALDPFADHHDPFLSHSEGTTDHEMDDIPSPVVVNPKVLNLHDISLARNIQALHERQEKSEKALKRALGEKDKLIETLAKQVEELSIQQQQQASPATKKKKKEKSKSKNKSLKRFQGQSTARVGMLGEIYDLSPKASPSLRRRTLAPEKLQSETFFADLTADSDDDVQMQQQQRRRESRAKTPKSIPITHNSTGGIDMRSWQMGSDTKEMSDELQGVDSSHTEKKTTRKRPSKTKKSKPRRFGSTGSMKDKKSRLGDFPEVANSADLDDDATRRKEPRTKAKKSNPRNHDSADARSDQKKKKRDRSPGRMASMISNLVRSKGSENDLKYESDKRREGRAKAKNGAPRRFSSTGALDSKKTSRTRRSSGVDASLTAFIGNQNGEFDDLNLDDMPLPMLKRGSKKRNSEKAKSRKLKQRMSQDSMGEDALPQALSSKDTKMGRRKSRKSLDVKDADESPSIPTAAPATPSSKTKRSSKKNKGSMDKLKEGMASPKGKKKVFVPPIKS